jgi:DNA-binding LacI/PurR family transcriptional regulator
VRPIHKLTIAEQTAEHVREGIRSGRWRGELPGVLLLAKTLDVSKDAMRAALHILEAEGLISPGHAGAHRAVLGNGNAAPRRALRVAILPREPLANECDVTREILHEMRHELEAAGHTVVFAAKTQRELRFDVQRIAKLVAATSADAWVVINGAREVLDIFATQPVPSIALGGRCIGAPVASVYVDAVPAYREVTRRLLALGHRRIILLCPRFWREPTPGRVAQAFTEELAAHGVTGSDFHLPDYEPSAAGLRTLFDSLFRVTPPTALIVELPEEAGAALLYLNQRGLAVPRDVSVFFPWANGAMRLCDPPIAHLHCENQHLMRRIVRWVRAVARGHADRDAVAVPAILSPGGSLGPART